MILQRRTSVPRQVFSPRRRLYEPEAIDSFCPGRIRDTLNPPACALHADRECRHLSNSVIISCVILPFARSPPEADKHFEHFAAEYLLNRFGVHGRRNPARRDRFHESNHRKPEYAGGGEIPVENRRTSGWRPRRLAPPFDPARRLCKRLFPTRRD